MVGACGYPRLGSQLGAGLAMRVVATVQFQANVSTADDHTTSGTIQTSNHIASHAQTDQSVPRYRYQTCSEAGEQSESSLASNVS